MPWLDRLLGKNQYCPIKFDTFEGAAYYSFQRLMERASSQDTKARGDFLDNFLEAKKQFPDIVSDNEVVSYLMMNVRGRARHLFPRLSLLSQRSFTILISWLTDVNRSSLVQTQLPSCRKPLRTTY